MQLRAIRKLGGQRDLRMDELQNTLSLVMFMPKEKKAQTADKGCLPHLPVTCSPLLSFSSVDELGNNWSLSTGPRDAEL